MTRAGLSRLVWLTGFACAGCIGGSGPTALRIRPDTNDRYYPQRDVYFVEHGQRGKGVLVSATAGYDNAFNASWATVLVPSAPSPLAGPSWNGQKVRGVRAKAIAASPSYRNSFYLGLYGDSVRCRFRESSVWILCTDPLVIGLPGGEPVHSWRQFALVATGARDAKHLTPVPPFVARFVVDEELG